MHCDAFSLGPFVMSQFENQTTHQDLADRTGGKQQDFSNTEILCTRTHLITQYLQQTPPFPNTYKAVASALSRYRTPSQRKMTHTTFHNEGLQDAAADCGGAAPLAPPPGLGGGGMAVATGCCFCCAGFSEFDTEEDWAGGMY
jgi:hypothetical protein